MRESLTVGEVARRLSISDEVVRRHARDGSLRGFQIGRRWRFDPEDLEQFIEARSSKPSEDGARAAS